MTNTYMIESSHKLHVVLSAKRENSSRKSLEFLIDENVKYGHYSRNETYSYRFILLYAYFVPD